MNELPEIISDLQLEEFADAKQFISKDIRVRRGQTSPEGIHRSDVAMFLGDFALELLDQETGEVVAGCGFRIQPYEGLDYMFITNTPQGRRLRSKNPDGISREAHGRLMCNTSFRDELLSVLSDLAGGLQLRGMIATSASNHSKTINHEISYKFGCRVIDELLLQNGFEYNVDGNLVKIFRKV